MLFAGSCMMWQGLSCHGILTKASNLQACTKAAILDVLARRFPQPQKDEAVQTQQQSHSSTDSIPALEHAAREQSMPSELTAALQAPHLRQLLHNDSNNSRSSGREL